MMKTTVESPGKRAVLEAPERVHPGLWRASQMARAPGLYAHTGHPDISAQLPGGGWPLGNLIEVMTPRAGIGELQLFRPALCGSTRTGLSSAFTGLASPGTQPDDPRPIVLIQPPYVPHISAWAQWGINPARLLWLSPQNSADALWAAEHILNSGAFAALVLWQHALRDSALRRLQLSAQKGDALFVLIRGLAAARQSSPAPLRLALHPTHAGLLVHIIKRRGNVSEHPVHVALYSDSAGRYGSPTVVTERHTSFSVDSGVPAPASTPVIEPHHANMDSRPFIAPHAGHPLP